MWDLYNMRVRKGKGEDMAVENIIRDKEGIQSGHKMLYLSRKFEK
jgi:hypothetical protein